MSANPFAYFETLFTAEYIKNDECVEASRAIRYIIHPRSIELLIALSARVRKGEADTLELSYRTAFNTNIADSIAIITNGLLSANGEAP